MKCKKLHEIVKIVDNEAELQKLQQIVAFVTIRQALLDVLQTEKGKNDPQYPPG